MRTPSERSSAAPAEPIHIDAESAIEEVVGVRGEAELRSLVGTYTD